MLRCREISLLVSESMERRLPWRTRMQVWMHLALCRLCAGFARQVRLLHRALHDHPERLADTERDAALSSQARERIKASLRGEQA